MPDGYRLIIANKQQRFGATAEGFMAGLVACGYRGPWHWSNLEWELPFYRVSMRWPPAQRDAALFLAYVAAAALAHVS